jgi:hypothetical protein
MLSSLILELLIFQQKEFVCKHQAWGYFFAQKGVLKPFQISKIYKNASKKN